MRAMPTFMLFDKSGEKLDEVVGADMKALETLLQKHDSTVPAPDAAKEGAHMTCLRPSACAATPVSYWWQNSHDMPTASQNSCTWKRLR